MRLAPMGVLAETYCCEIKSDLHSTGFDHGIAKPESPLIVLGEVREGQCRTDGNPSCTWSTGISVAHASAWLPEVEVVDMKPVVALPPEGLIQRLRVDIGPGGGERHPQLPIAPRAIRGRLEQRAPGGIQRGEAEQLLRFIGCDQHDGVTGREARPDVLGSPLDCRGQLV